MKAKDIKPGMLISYELNGHNRFELVTARVGLTEAEITTFDLNSADMGRMCHTLKIDHEIKVITGDVKMAFIEKIKHEIFDHLNSVNNDVDTIRLIEAMSEA